jgi:hypothetical protein
MSLFMIRIYYFTSPPLLKRRDEDHISPPPQQGRIKPLNLLPLRGGRIKVGVINFLFSLSFP